MGTKPTQSRNNDNMFKQKVTLMVMAVLVLVLFVCILWLIIASIQNSDNNNEDGTEAPSGEVTDNINYTSMTLSAADLQKGNLVLVNSQHQFVFPDENNRVSIYNYRSEHNGSGSYKLGSTELYLEPEAVEAMHNMLVEFAKETGNSSLNVTSAYRSYEDQESTNSSIKAGYSDSHTGLSFSLAMYENNITTQLTDPENAEYYDWLKEHAHEYGFIIRYPEGKESVTGVSNYAYAFRYVGVPHATYMYTNNLCLEEYIDYLKTNSSFDSKLSVTDDGGHTYLVYYTPSAGDITEIKVPAAETGLEGSAKYPYTVSGTNEGGAVVTVQLN